MADSVLPIQRHSKTKQQVKMYTGNHLADLLNKSASLISGFEDEEDKQREFYRKNPAKWAWDKVAFECKGIQEPVLHALADGKDAAMRSGHSCGKSGVAGIATLWWLDTHVDSKVMTTAPGERQLKHILWAEIGARFASWSDRWQWQLTRGMNLYNKQRPSTWFALGIYSQDAGKIEGFHTETEGNLLIIVDEAKAVPDDFFVAVSSMVGRKLMTSVPPLNARGYFYDAFTRFREMWACFHMSTLDSPFVTAQWIEDRKKDWFEGSATWQAKILGEFPKNISTNLLINPGTVEDAQARWEGWKEWSEQVAVGVDVARFGDDRTVIADLVYPKVVKIIETSKQDTMMTVGRIIENLNWIEREMEKKKLVAEARKIPIMVDDTGLGGGVTDRLSELEYNVIPICFGSKAVDAVNYANKRTELWCNLALAMDWLAVPTDEAMNGAGARLAAELSSVQFEYTSTGKKLEPKEKVKKRLGNSPDIADAVALCVEGLAMMDGGRVGVEVW
jgi:phage terminase large subunit